MSFIAVFTNGQIPVSFEFDHLPDAIDFLDWINDEKELVSLGIYDRLKQEAMPYKKLGEEATSSISTYNMATDYLTSVTHWKGLPFS